MTASVEEIVNKINFRQYPAPMDDEVLRIRWKYENYKRELLQKAFLQNRGVISPQPSEILTVKMDRQEYIHTEYNVTIRVSDEDDYKLRVYELFFSTYHETKLKLLGYILTRMAGTNRDYVDSSVRYISYLRIMIESMKLGTLNYKVIKKISKLSQERIVSYNAILAPEEELGLSGKTLNGWIFSSRLPVYLKDINGRHQQSWINYAKIISERIKVSSR